MNCFNLVDFICSKLCLPTRVVSNTVLQNIKQIEKNHLRNTYVTKRPSDRKQCKRWREVNEKRVLKCEPPAPNTVLSEEKKLASAVQRPWRKYRIRTAARCQHFLTRCAALCRAVPRCRRHRCSRRHSQQTTADFYHASATDSTLPCSNICLLCIFLSSPYIKNYHVRQSKQYLVGFVLCTELRKFVSCFIRMSTNECTVHVWLLCYLMKMGKLVQLYTWTDQERYWVNLYVTEA